MGTYMLTRVTIIAPAVRNDGVPSGYPAALRSALLREGIAGWTEHRTIGSWHGVREPGVLFEFYVEHGSTFAYKLGAIGRECMPDQEAIQVTYESHATTLIEA